MDITVKELISFMENNNAISGDIRTISYWKALLEASIGKNEINENSELNMSNISSSNLKQYLVWYEKLIEAPHALLDDEIITLSKVVEVSNAIEINDLFKNIVDIKRIF